MATFLVAGHYTDSGVKTLVQDGGSGRVAAARRIVEAFGGRLISMHFAFGSDDFYCIVEGPNNIGAAASSLLVASLGVAHVRVVVLLTPEEVDQAARQVSGALAAMQGGGS